MADCERCKLDAPAYVEPVGGDKECIGPVAHEGGKGRLDLAAGAGVENLEFAIRERVQLRGMSRSVASAVEVLVGLTSTAIRTALGTRLCRSPSRLAATSARKKLMPVALPPGRARLATRPILTGSAPTPKTIGIVVVAALAASAAGLLPGVAITATWRRMRSAMSDGS